MKEAGAIPVSNSAGKRDRIVAIFFSLAFLFAMYRYLVSKCAIT